MKGEEKHNMQCEIMKLKTLEKEIMLTYLNHRLKGYEERNNKLVRMLD